VTAQRWTTKDITRELELASTAHARSLISRWRKKGNPAGTPVWVNIRTGERWYDAELVTAAWLARPGRGWRAGQPDTDHRGSTP